MNFVVYHATFHSNLHFFKFSEGQNGRGPSHAICMFESLDLAEI